jgi:hypothetical protein
MLPPPRPCRTERVSHLAPRLKQLTYSQKRAVFGELRGVRGMRVGHGDLLAFLQQPQNEVLTRVGRHDVPDVGAQNSSS